MYQVYVATHKDSGKCYVGQTCQGLAKRWAVHLADSKRDSERYFCRALNKYGADAFDLQQLAEIETKEEADNLEKCWIILLRASERQFGYNLTMGGDGCKPSPELKAKIASRLRRGPDHPFYGKRLPCIEQSIIARKENARIRKLYKEQNPEPKPPKKIKRGTERHNYRSDIVDADLARLYQAGISTLKLAAKFNTSKLLIRRRLKKSGIALRPSGRPKGV